MQYLHANENSFLDIPPEFLYKCKVPYNELIKICGEDTYEHFCGRMHKTMKGDFSKIDHGKFITGLDSYLPFLLHICLPKEERESDKCMCWCPCEIQCSVWANDHIHSITPCTTTCTKILKDSKFPMSHNDFMNHLDDNRDCPLHRISRYYLRFMVKNVDNWYKKGKDNDLNDVLYVVDDAYVKPREGVESKKM